MATTATPHVPERLPSLQAAWGAVAGLCRRVLQQLLPALERNLARARRLQDAKLGHDLLKRHGLAGVARDGQGQASLRDVDHARTEDLRQLHHLGAGGARGGAQLEEQQLALCRGGASVFEVPNTPYQRARGR